MAILDGNAVVIASQNLKMLPPYPVTSTIPEQRTRPNREKAGSTSWFRLFNFWNMVSVF